MGNKVQVVFTVEREEGEKHFKMGGASLFLLQFWFRLTLPGLKKAISHLNSYSARF